MNAIKKQINDCQEMRDTYTLNLAEEMKNLIKNVNDKAITQYIEILPWKTKRENSDSLSIFLSYFLILSE